MRNAFFRALEELFTADARVHFITGDLGFKLYDKLAEHAPGRVINAGIREAAIAGMAAGLAAEGALPFIYSITPFITLRCVEQVKLDVCYHNLNVAIIGVGGGYAYGENGPTHHGVEDLALMRLLPGMTVLCPCDPAEVEACVAAVPKINGPVYIRLGRNGEPDLHAGAMTDPLKPVVLRNGDDLTIVGTGPVLGAALSAAESLSSEGISARVVKVTCLKPLDEGTLAGLIVSGKPVLSVEEHTAGAALALPLADLLLRSGFSAKFSRLNIRDEFPARCGSHAALLTQCGLDAASIAAECKSLAGG